MVSQVVEGALLLAPDLQEQEVYVGSARISIVGVQYYSGIISNTEAVTFRREPTNPYDVNAIGVHASHDPNRNKLGHISRQNAALLAPMMDTRGLRLEGSVGKIGKFQIPLDIHLFCPRANMAVVQHALRQLPTAGAPKHVNFDPAAVYLVDLDHIAQTAYGPPRPAGAATAPSYGAPSEAAVLRHLDSLFIEPIPYDAQPEAPQPRTVLTSLYPHQLKALAWMLERETPMNVATALAHQRQQAAAAIAAAAARGRDGAGAGSSTSSSRAASSLSSSSNSSSSSASADPDGAALERILSRARASAASRCFMWEVRACQAVKRLGSEAVDYAARIMLHTLYDFFTFISHSIAICRF